MALVIWSRKAHYPLDLRAELNFYAQILIAITLLATIQLPLGNNAFSGTKRPSLSISSGMPPGWKTAQSLVPQPGNGENV